jgi:tetratricopeptide (TPR) repeat protein
MLNRFRALTAAALFTASTGEAQTSAVHDAGHDHPAAIGGIPMEFLARPPALRTDVGRVTAGPAAERLAQRYFEQGLSLLYLYTYLDAARSFRYAIQLDPGYAEAYAGLARAYSNLNDRDAARAALDTAAMLSAHADSATQLRILLRDSRRRGDDWREVAEDAVQRYPTDLEFRMIHALLVTGEDRIRRYQAVLELAPEYAGVHHLLVHAYEGLKKYDDAVRHGQILARLAPGVSHARHMFGHNLLRVGRAADAARQFAAADSLERAYYATESVPSWYDWHHPHNLHLLGQAFWHQGEARQAEAVLRRRAELRQSDGRTRPRFVLDVVDVLLSDGRPAEALALAGPLADGDTTATSRIAAALASEALAALGRFDEARRKYEAAGPPEPGSHAGRFTARAHAIMLIHSGSHAKAVEYIDSIIPELRVDRGPDGWVASLLHIEAIGRAAAQAGDSALASRIGRELVEHDPSYAGGHRLVSGR